MQDDQQITYIEFRDTDGKLLSVGKKIDIDSGNVVMKATVKQSPSVVINEITEEEYHILNKKLKT